MNRKQRREMMRRLLTLEQRAAQARHEREFFAKPDADMRRFFVKSKRRDDQ